MKKTYISPALMAIKLDSNTNMCVNSLPINTEDPGGASQLSKAFWGETIFDDTEEEDIDEGSIF